MSDFAQLGAICTLQRLNEWHLEAVEERLAESARARPVALILPCHGRDLGQPALAHIFQELRGATWLSEIVLSVNSANDEELTAVRLLTEEMPARVRILRTDSPAMQTACGRLLDGNEPPVGKGFNVWAALGLLVCEGRAAVVATQDCDVTSFRRQTLARLCAACADERLRFRFAKMYYSRVTDRLYGRVTRLFFAPLLRAILRVAGHAPLLDFLSAFRYALAGEMALDRELAGTLELEAGWGLETAMLCQAYRHTEPETVCQVDGGTGYDHRHQHSGADGLAPMCAEVTRTLLHFLGEEGVRFVEAGRAALASAYGREAALALRRSEALAYLNGLPFEAETERELTAGFARQLGTAGRPRLLPAWTVLQTQKPELVAAFAEVAAGH